MNEILLNVISVVVTSIVIPLISYLGIKLSNYLKTKTNNEKMKAYIDQATNSISLAVASTMQVYVDALKKDGKFDKEAQDEAFAKARETALALMTKDAKSAVTALYGDFNEWINAQIESQVKTIKEK